MTVTVGDKGAVTVPQAHSGIALQAQALAQAEWQRPWRALQFPSEECIQVHHAQAPSSFRRERGAGGGVGG